MAAKKKRATKTKTVKARTKKGAKKAVKKAAPRRKAPAKRKASGVRWALGISGSGSRSAFLVGALKQLQARGNHSFPVIAGTGTGALVAAILAQGRGHELEEFASVLGSRKALRLRYPFVPHVGANLFLASVTNTQSVYTIEGGLSQLIDRFVDIQAVFESSIEVHFVTRDMQTGAVRSFGNRGDGEQDLLRGLFAATSRPVLMPLVRAGEEGHQYTGDPLRADATLTTLYRALDRADAPAVDRMLILSQGCGREPARDYRDVVSIFERTLDIAEGVGIGNVSTARLINALLTLRDKIPERTFAGALKSLDAETRSEVQRHLGKRNLPLCHLCPDGELADVSALTYDARAIQRALEAGAHAAKSIAG